MLDFLEKTLSFEVLAFACIAIPLFIIFAMRKPAMCFFLGLPALIYLGVLKDIFPVSVSLYAAIFPFAGMTGQVLRGNSSFFKNYGLCEKLLMILALWMIYSISYTTNPAYGQQKTLLFLFMVIPIVIFSPKVVTNFLSLRIAISMITISFLGYVVISLFMLPMKEMGVYRVSGIGDVTVAGQYLFAAVIISFVNSYFGKPNVIARSSYIFWGVIAFILLIFTGTRAPFLAGILTILFLFWFNHTDWFVRIYNKFGIFVVVFLIVATTLLVIKNIIPEYRIDRFIKPEILFNNFTLERIYNWQESKSRTLNYFSAIEGIISHPARGVGAGGYERIVGVYYPIRKDYSELVNVYPHNILLEFGVEQGLPGLFLILFILYLNFKVILNLRKFIQKEDAYRWQISFCVGIYIYGLFLSMASLDIPRMMIFWWGMGLLLIANKIFLKLPFYLKEKI
jgi:O-antigen ligase